MKTRTDKDSINLKLKVKYNLRFESIACPPAMSRTGLAGLFAAAQPLECGSNLRVDRVGQLKAL